MKPIQKTRPFDLHSKVTILLITVTFTFLALSCKKEDEKFNPDTYIGEYPRDLDGSQIQTYKPDIQGGKLNASFNGHSWNHTPHFLIEAAAFDNAGFADTTVKLLQVYVQAFSENANQGKCSKETLLIRVPLKGATVLNAYLTDSLVESDIINFATMDCNTVKDRFILDRSKLNFINIESYDKDTREINVEFDVSFNIITRNTHFGPVYPGKVNLIGGIRTVVRK